MSNSQKPIYGGQAVVEGVMFGGKHHYVTAIRRKDHSIEYFHLPRKVNPSIAKLKKIPFLRGIISIIESSANGSKHLNFSTERFDVDPKDDDTIKEKEVSKLTMYLRSCSDWSSFIFIWKICLYVNSCFSCRTNKANFPL